jgi:hypothetical protein
MATASGCDVWTFDVPPLDYEHNGYDDMGWLDVAKPCLPDNEIERNPDGTISICFGDDRCAGRPNVIETTGGQRFYYGIRLYRPRDAVETVTYIEQLRSNPIQPITRWLAQHTSTTRPTTGSSRSRRSGNPIQLASGFV